VIGSASPSSAAEQVGIGVVVPYDMALDRELWRWAPDDVSLLFTRTPYAPLPVTVEMAEHVGDVDVVQQAALDLLAVSPAVLAYACTSGSFVRGLDGERALVDAMLQAGAPSAVTTSGALVEALRHLGVTRVAIATPYDAEMTVLLAGFLAAAGVQVLGEAHLGLTGQVWRVPYARTREAVRRADSPDAEAVVVSCTNLPTYDLIPQLEAEIGKPVVSANQATMWAALLAAGRPGGPRGQLLFDREVRTG
jgi:maleate isomerase